MDRIFKSLCCIFTFAVATAAPAVRYTMTYRATVASFQIYEDSVLGAANTLFPASDLTAILTFDDLTTPDIASFAAGGGIDLHSLPTSFSVTLGTKHFDLDPAGFNPIFQVSGSQIYETASGRLGDLSIYLHIIEGPNNSGFAAYDTKSITFVPKPGDLDSVSFDLSLPDNQLYLPRVTTQSVTVAIGPTSDVPDSPIWATMIVGFGVIGGTLRRRRSRPVAFAPVARSPIA